MKNIRIKNMLHVAEFVLSVIKYLFSKESVSLASKYYAYRKSNLKMAVILSACSRRLLIILI